MGQSAYTIGFPLGDVMGSSPRLSSGLISALFGLRDDPRVLQISNPVQPGNSGGPLLNESGELVGIVVSGLSAKYFYENAGIIPQNMNFAVKGAYLRSLIEMLPSGHDLLKPALSPLKGLPLDRQVEKVTPFVANVIAYGPESGSPSRVSEPPTPVSSHEDPIVLMIPRGAIYHKSKDCISLTGHDQIQFRLSQVATWAKPCPQCKPLTR